MIIHDMTYNKLASHILTYGTFRDDRTGVGTIAEFGCRMEFNLRQGFPLLTGKKLPFRAIAWELIWFLEGRTDVEFLQQRNVSIWDEWADSNGNLGPIYGHSWRKFGGKVESIPQPHPKSVGSYCGVADGFGSANHPLQKTWQGMIQRCYGLNDVGYELYGKKGVHVCDDWLTFIKFARDATKLPGYDEKLIDDLNLDKDGLGNGFLYSPTTCQWLTPSENCCLKSSKVYTVEKSGIQYKFRNPAVFCREMGIDDGNFSDLWTGRKNAKIRHGFSLVSVVDESKGVDQLQDVVDRIKTKPHDRRLIVSAWNPPEIPDMALPPCHLLYQFFVQDGQLSLQMYQRSCDMFLGVPFNIASYSLLTHIVAHICGLEVGRFIWIGGDCHFYLNHVDQIDEQLRRSYRISPTLKVSHLAPKDLHDWTPDNFELSYYNPHPSIKAPVAV